MHTKIFAFGFQFNKMCKYKTKIVLTVLQKRFTILCWHRNKFLINTDIQLLNTRKMSQNMKKKTAMKKNTVYVQDLNYT